MTRDETIALFLECEAKRAEARAAALAERKSEDDASEIAHEAAKAHWNAWADCMLAKRKELAASGLWAAEKDIIGNPVSKNAETRGWMKEAQTVFSRCLFLVREAEGSKETPGEIKEQPGSGDLPVKPIAIDDRTIDFRAFVFPGNTSFESATFSGFARFQSATFSGDASFDSAAFSGSTSFDTATFSGRASFDSATFTGSAWFVNATFSGEAWFDSATFGDAWFVELTFSDTAWFASATFSCRALFFGQTFTHDVFFSKAKFDEADFASATFKGGVQFVEATFEGEADFNAVLGERIFSMAGARFEGVPDFIQAHFAEAPRLDNVVVKGRMPQAQEKEPEDGDKLLRRERLHRKWQDKSPLYHWAMSGISKDSELRDIPARWRALKRLAIQGHDTDRELQFFSGEVRSARFAGDWPLPWPVWKASAWGGLLLRRMALSNLLRFRTLPPSTLPSVVTLHRHFRGLFPRPEPRGGRKAKGPAPPWFHRTGDCLQHRRA